MCAKETYMSSLHWFDIWNLGKCANTVRKLVILCVRIENFKWEKLLMPISIKHVIVIRKYRRITLHINEIQENSRNKNSPNLPKRYETVQVWRPPILGLFGTPPCQQKSITEEPPPTPLCWCNTWTNIELDNTTW